MATEVGLSPGQSVCSARILVVDDNEDIRSLLATALSGAGYEVDTAGNGFEALQRLEQKGYDLVVSDLKMPELDGPGLYRQMTRRWANSCPRVLFVSGFVDTSDYVGFLNVTNIPVLVKPLDLEELQQAVKWMLEEA